MDNIKLVDRILKEFRTIDHTASTQALAIFLTVCQEEGLSLSEIGERTNMNLSTVSRNSYVLSKVNYRRKPGMDLVVHKDDPVNWRQRQLWLTPKGKLLKQKIIDINS